jgi:hypothetical protein
MHLPAQEFGALGLRLDLPAVQASDAGCVFCQRTIVFVEHTLFNFMRGIQNPDSPPPGANSARGNG